MSERAHRVLREGFGYEAFRAGQEDIIGKILSGQNVLAVMPTGAGKSLCYQIPALVLDRLTIVVSPLVSLIDDQVAALKANGFRVGRLHSGRERADNVEDWRAVAAGEIKLLYMSPERLMTTRMIEALRKLDPALFVVDEAHCVSKWGTSFRPDYAALSGLKDVFPEAVIAGFTATADIATQKDIAGQLFAGKGDVLVQGFDRPNLSLSVEPKTKWQNQLKGFLSDRQGQSGVVYCLSRKLTEQVTAFLQGEGYRALPYHAGMPAEERRENQEIFMSGDATIMVATVAFGMGIDKADIRFVFHLNLPGSFEAYYQEIGRAGRDGQPADAFMIYGLDDIRNRRAFIEQDGEDQDHKRREHKRLDALLSYCEAPECRRKALLRYFGEDHQDCGNCDICLDPPVLEDRTGEASRLFSAVEETGQRFGAQHVIGIVCGDKSRKILDMGHDRVSAYAQGENQPRTFWQSLVRQAVAGGYLAIDIEQYGGLKLTQRGHQLLQGQESFNYRQLPQSARAARKNPSAVAANCADPSLFLKLKALRKDIASDLGVPAFAVFPDQTILNMIEARPASLDEMLDVSGIGPKKLTDFGEQFLAEMLNHRA